MSVQEVLYFDERLERSSMPRGAFVVNRFRVPPPAVTGTSPLTRGDVSAAIGARGLSLDDDAPERVLRAYEEAKLLAEMDAANVRELEARAASGKVPVLRVPELVGDVHDAARLGALAETLMAGGLR
jgi:hypothetical protein